MQLSIDQSNALSEIEEFLQNAETEHILTGGPGVGKSFLVQTIVQMVKERSRGRVRIYITATTNRAAAVLGKMVGEPAQTIHKLLSLVVKNNYKTGKKELVKSRKEPFLTQRSLIICDEISYADPDLHKYIVEYADRFGCKVLYVGDEFQLLPVGTYASVFTFVKNKSELTTIHRQDEGSSILYEAAKYRRMIQTQTFHFENFESSSDISVLSREDYDAKIKMVFESDDYILNPDHAKVLAWRNKTVDYYAQGIRSLFYDNPAPQRGEHLIVNTSYGDSSNGGIAFPTEAMIEIEDVAARTQWGIKGWDVLMRMEDIRGWAFKAEDFGKVKTYLNSLAREAKQKKNWKAFFDAQEQFIDLRPVYASTVHKAQGGTMDVIFMDLDDIAANPIKDELARLIYVSLTRARRHIYITGSFPSNHLAC